VGVGIRGEDAGVFGCLLQGDNDIVNAAYIKVHVRGRRWRFPIDVYAHVVLKIKYLQLMYGGIGMQRILQAA